jgi:hypothetical protein
MYAQIEAHIRTPFSWSENSCGLFVARVVDAMTDSQIAEQIIAAVASEEEAASFIESRGGMRAAISGFLGEPSGDRPRRGDVVLFDGGEGDAVGIWTGAEIVSVGEAGLRRIRAREFTAVWHV